MAIFRLPSESPKVNTGIFCGVWGQGHNEEQGLSALQHAAFNDTSIREGSPEHSSHLSWSQIENLFTQPGIYLTYPLLFQGKHHPPSQLSGMLFIIRGERWALPEWDLPALLSTALSPDEMLWTPAGHVSLQEWEKGLALLSKSCYGTKGRPSSRARNLFLNQ